MSAELNIRPRRFSAVDVPPKVALSLALRTVFKSAVVAGFDESA